jgi:predicted nuclease with TOPRIM domain
MRSEEERERLRAENSVLREALQRKDEELHQSRQSNQDLREGLRQAIMAIESLREHVKTLEGQIDCLQERVKTLEGQQAKIATTVACLPPQIVLFVPPRVCDKRVGRDPVDSTAIVGIT